MSAPVMGIDPGQSGAVALLLPDQKPLIWTFAGMTLHDMWIVIGGCASYDGVEAYIEDVHSMPKQGVSSSFKFGRHYGNLEAFLTAHQIPFDRVQPSVWQRSFSLTRKSKDETLTAKKNRHKALAQEFWPKAAGHITHATADALLIAEYGRRLRG